MFLVLTSLSYCSLCVSDLRYLGYFLYLLPPNCDEYIDVDHEYYFVCETGSCQLLLLKLLPNESGRMRVAWRVVLLLIIAGVVSTLMLSILRCRLRSAIRRRYGVAGGSSVAVVAESSGVGSRLVCCRKMP